MPDNAADFVSPIEPNAGDQLISNEVIHENDIAESIQLPTEVVEPESPAIDEKENFRRAENYHHRHSGAHVRLSCHNDCRALLYLRRKALAHLLLEAFCLQLYLPRLFLELCDLRHADNRGLHNYLIPARIPFRENQVQGQRADILYLHSRNDAAVSGDIFA